MRSLREGALFRQARGPYISLCENDSESRNRGAERSEATPMAVRPLELLSELRDDRGGPDVWKPPGRLGRQTDGLRKYLDSITEVFPIHHGARNLLEHHNQQS